MAATYSRVSARPEEPDARRDCQRGSGVAFRERLQIVFHARRMHEIRGGFQPVGGLVRRSGDSSV